MTAAYLRTDGDPRLVAFRGVQVLLAAITASAVVTLDGGLLFNAGMPLALSLVPWWLERGYGFSMEPRMRLWLGVALGLHAIGSTGVYQLVPVFDQVAHAVSSTIVAGVGYAVVLALDRHSPDVDVTPAFRGAFVLLFVLAFGVVWEILEFAYGGLAVYGIDDVVYDLLFNALGGLLVALWGTGYFDDWAGFVARRFVTGTSGESDR